MSALSPPEIPPVRNHTPLELAHGTDGGDESDVEIPEERGLDGAEGGRLRPLGVVQTAAPTSIPRGGGTVAPDEIEMLPVSEQDRRSTEREGGRQDVGVAGARMRSTRMGVVRLRPPGTGDTDRTLVDTSGGHILKHKASKDTPMMEADHPMLAEIRPPETTMPEPITLRGRPAVAPKKKTQGRSFPRLIWDELYKQLWGWVKPHLTWKKMKPVIRCGVAAWVGLLVMLIYPSEMTLGIASFLTLVGKRVGLSKDPQVAA